MRRLLDDSLAFCGAEILRRVFGFARALDLESIPDPDLRAGCERRCAALARDLLVHTDRYRSVDDVCGAVAAGLPGSPV